MRFPDDARWMAQAIALAQRGLCSTAPNPRVGCVLVKQGEWLADGWHRMAGGPHAEVDALQQAGERARGATAYVSLEPCNHHGRTGPCTEALIHAGIARVVYGMADPNPRVAGQGLQRLQQAGITVDGPLQPACAAALNPGFIKRMRTGLPFVRIKMAMSLDGRTAMASGESQWITGDTARRDVQQWRARSCAILTSAATALADHAQLTVREPDCLVALGSRRPLRVLLDTHARVPLTAPLFAGDAPTLWYTNGAAPSVLPANVTHRLLPTDTQQHADLTAVLQQLAQRECNEVLVEAGPTLTGSLLQAQLVDELLIYMAPCLLGSNARPLFDLPFATMAEAQSLTVRDLRAVGNDWRFTLTPRN